MNSKDRDELLWMLGLIFQDVFSEHEKLINKTSLIDYNEPPDEKYVNIILDNKGAEAIYNHWKIKDNHFELTYWGLTQFAGAMHMIIIGNYEMAIIATWSKLEGFWKMIAESDNQYGINKEDFSNSAILHIHSKINKKLGYNYGHRYDESVRALKERRDVIMHFDLNKIEKIRLNVKESKNDFLLYSNIISNNINGMNDNVNIILDVIEYTLITLKK